LARLENLMKGPTMKWRFARTLGLSLALACGGALADSFPTRPVRIIVPFAPGGNLDVTARIVAESMAKELGQPFIVDNRPGAGGTIGSEAVAKAPPDGYTLVAGTTATSIVSPLLVPNPPYELQSFAPIGMMAVTPLVLEVPAASPHKDFRSYVAYVRANPGRVTIGHSGNGTTNHVAILLMQDALKVNWNVIPYKGSGPALVDLIGGQIDSMMDQTSSSLPQIQGGKLRALAVGTRTRVADLPNVPTLAEEGMKDFEAVTPSGLFAPAKTPADVVGILNAALNKALADPAIRKRLADLGSEPRPMSAEQFDQILKEEERKFKALAKSGVLKSE
jgi:tripartite-type tricarboxylate transporter receptor subunit TctC